jgi:hypothetical protein
MRVILTDPTPTSHRSSSCQTVEQPSEDGVYDASKWRRS